MCVSLSPSRKACIPECFSNCPQVEKTLFVHPPLPRPVAAVASAHALRWVSGHKDDSWGMFTFVGKIGFVSQVINRLPCCGADPWPQVDPTAPPKEHAPL